MKKHEIVERIVARELAFLRWFKTATALQEQDKSIESWDKIPYFVPGVYLGAQILKTTVKVPTDWRSKKDAFLIHVINILIHHAQDLYESSFLLAQARYGNQRGLGIGRRVSNGDEYAFFWALFEFDGNLLTIEIMYGTYVAGQKLHLALSADEDMIKPVVRTIVAPQFYPGSRVVATLNALSLGWLLHIPVGLLYGIKLLFALLGLWLGLYLAIGISEALIREKDKNGEMFFTEWWLSWPKHLFNLGWTNIWTIAAVLLLITSLSMSVSTTRRKYKHRKHLLETTFNDTLGRYLSFIFMPAAYKDVSSIKTVIQQSQDHRNFLDRMMNVIQQVQAVVEST